MKRYLPFWTQQQLDRYLPGVVLNDHGDFAAWCRAHLRGDAQPLHFRMHDGRVMEKTVILNKAILTSVGQQIAFYLSQPPGDVNTQQQMPHFEALFRSMSVMYVNLGDHVAVLHPRQSSQGQLDYTIGRVCNSQQLLVERDGVYFEPCEQGRADMLLETRSYHPGPPLDHGRGVWGSTVPLLFTDRLIESEETSSKRHFLKFCPARLFSAMLSRVYE